MPGRVLESRPQSGLLGRGRERAVLDQLLADIRQGVSRALVLLGEAGIGKTALLQYLIESATDVHVVRAAGAESEAELAYAGLQQVCAPMLAELERLPAPRREALETVFGLRSGGVPDRFLVGLGVLTLFSDAATERPLLCVIDDTQWLDQASALTLAFVARRVSAEPVGLVFAARSPARSSRIWRRWRWTVCGMGTRGRCWPRPRDSRWTGPSVTGSSPRAAAIHQRCSSSRAG
jgi:hypothetical protein